MSLRLFSTWRGPLHTTARLRAILLLDSARIRQVLLNLLSNAARVTNQGGITIRSKVSNQEVIIQVSDTGPGIPQADLQRVFEEFQQSDVLQMDFPTRRAGAW